METLALRLHPGQDLKIELDRLMEKHKIEAACILTCVGSLTTAVLRFANQETSARLDGHFEIVSLTGVLSRHGSHYHIAIADERGTSYGAHLLDGCKVYTTAEIVIGIIPATSFLRTFDPETGYPELEVVSPPHKGAGTMSLSKHLKEDFTTTSVVLISIAIVINIVAGQLVSMLKLPIFLDSIGTVLVGLLAGPWAGGVTGLLTNLIWGMISSPVAAAFSPVAMAIGIAAGLCAKYGLFKTWWLAIISGLIIAIFNAVVAVPIRLYMFGGITGSGADFITSYMLALSKDLFGSVVVTVFTSNLIDKVVTALLAWTIVKALPLRTTARMPRAKCVVTTT